MTSRIRVTARIAAVALVGVLVASCANPLNGRGEMIAYDFGPVAPVSQNGKVVRQSLLVHDVTGPAWMETPALHYRLAYIDAARPQAYASSRWVMPPSALLSSRLRQRLSGLGGGVLQPTDGLRPQAALRVELDEFTHVFDKEASSRGVVRLRASLVGPRSLIAQRTFSVDKAATQPNAEGGVRALAEASDEAVEQLVEWVAVSLKD